MEKKFEFTKSQLTKAFQKWNVDCIENPDNFCKIDETDECAKDQAEKLIELLA